MHIIIEFMNYLQSVSYSLHEKLTKHYFLSYWKCNSPITPYIRLLVGRLVGSPSSVCKNFLKEREFTFNACISEHLFNHIILLFKRITFRQRLLVVIHISVLLSIGIFFSFLSSISPYLN